MYILFLFEIHLFIYVFIYLIIYTGKKPFTEIIRKITVVAQYGVYKVKKWLLEILV